jgi:hypothetical protein
MPYLIPTPTRGRALITFFTVVWSANANMMEAETLEIHEKLDLKQNVLKFQILYRKNGIKKSYKTCCTRIIDFYFINSKIFSALTFFYIYIYLYYKELNIHFSNVLKQYYNINLL